jgi:shikimate kinase
MTRDREFDRPSRYRISVKGHLDDSWSEWLGGLVITEDDDMTVLSGTITDQAALYGLLIKLRDLNLILMSMNREDAPASVKE